MVRTRAGTFPVFDPTWNVPSIVILSCLEIQGAVICASIPFFWPVLVQLAFGKILVVEEIHVDSIERQFESTDFGQFQPPQDSCFSSTTNRSCSSDRMMDKMPDKVDASGSSLTMHHLVDEYTLAQISPLNTTHEVVISRGSVPVAHIEALSRTHQTE
jgi:hypothetical protein